MLNWLPYFGGMGSIVTGVLIAGKSSYMYVLVSVSKVGA